MRRRLYFEIFAASLAAILLEVAYTRVFSFKVYYAFTYLVVGLALLGLGIGGALVAASPKIANRGAERIVPETCLLGAASVLAGYLLVARVQLNASAIDHDVFEVAKLVGTCSVLALPFVAVGVVLSLAFSTHTDAIGKLYGADLLGAAAGCSVAIFLLEALDPPRVIMLAGAALALAALRLAAPRRMLLASAGAVAAALLLSGTFVRWLPDAVVDRAKGFETYRSAGLIRTTRYDPVFRVDVADAQQRTGDLVLLFHDGLPGSALRRVGSAAFDHLDASSRKLPFEALRNKHPRVLIIGSAGGHEIVAALRFGAAHVTAVELNAATLSLLRGEYAEFTGRLHEDPRVTLVHGDGRWFLAQSDDEFDLIWMVAPDSYAAMNAATSAAFVLAESYLYTVEMMSQVFAHLAEGGLLCAQFGEVDIERKPNRTLRFVSTARQFYRDERIPDFPSRVFIASSQGLPPFAESTVLLSRTALRAEQIAAAKLQTSERMPGGVVRYAPGHRRHDTLIREVVLTPPDLIGEWYRQQPYRLTPVRDDAPFFWHFASFSDAAGGSGLDEPELLDYEDGLGERALLVLLLVSAVVGLSFAIVPLLGLRDTWRAMPHKASAAVYFCAVGVGFMFIEIPLIQKLTLLLGFPTRSLTVTLFSLLLSTGIGALLSSRYIGSPQRASGLLLAALFALLSLWHLVLPYAVREFSGSPLAVRTFVAVSLLAPLGVCLGGFLPIGLAAVASASEHPRQFVAWAWSVNALASVVGAILAAILAMMTGFKFLLVAAPVIYAAGVLALFRIHPTALREPGRSE